MKQFLSILSLWLMCFAAQAADRITATITVTNNPSAGNMLTVNAAARTWQSSVSAPATEILIGADIGASTTNLFLQIAANPYSGPLTVAQTATNVVQITGTVGGALAASASGTWATITLSTQSVTTAYAVRVPAAAEPTQSRATNIISELVRDIGVYSTNAIPAAAKALENFVGLSTAQTISGAKLHTASNQFSAPLSITNAQQYFRTGAGITLETNLLVTDLNSGNAYWQFNVSEKTNGVVTFQDVTNKQTALKAADNSWTGFNTFTRMTGGATNLVMTNGATGAGTFTVGSDLSYTRANHTSLANGNNANVDFGSSTVYAKIKAGPTASFTINGIQGGRNGRVLILDNSTGQSMTIANDSGVDATPANRIYTRTGTDVTTGTGGCVTLVYDSESSRWILVTFNAGGAGVTSVGVSAPLPFNVSGSPVTSAGTISLTLPHGTNGSGAIVLANSPTITNLTVSGTFSGPLNSSTVAGLVPAGSGHEGELYMVDELGNPGWFAPDELETGTLLVTTNIVLAGASHTPDRIAYIDANSNLVSVTQWKVATGHLTATAPATYDIVDVRTVWSQDLRATANVRSGSTGGFIIGSRGALLAESDGQMVIWRNDLTTLANLSLGTVKGYNGSGTDGAGTKLTIEGGNSTGTGRGGDVVVRTAESDTASGSSANTLVTRHYASAKWVNLTESTATTIANVAIPQGDVISIMLHATTSAGDATERQVVGDNVMISAVNKAGTITATVSAASPTATAASSGTLTTTWTAVASGDSIDIKCNAVSSLTQTFLRCRWQANINSSDVATVTPQ